MVNQISTNTLNSRSIKTYQQTIKDQPVMLVEFYASWCPHCRQMMPVVAQIKELLQGRAGFLQLDVDKNEQASDYSSVGSIPTFILYVDGTEQWRHTGEIDGEVLLSNIMSYTR